MSDPTEQVAEAIWRADHNEWINNTGTKWADIREDWRDKYRRMAQQWRELWRLKCT